MQRFMKSQTSLIFVLSAVWVERLITWATRAETVTRDFNVTDYGLAFNNSFQYEIRSNIPKIQNKYKQK
jgi:hypothetical protein